MSAVPPTQQSGMIYYSKNEKDDVSMYDCTMYFGLA